MKGFYRFKIVQKKISYDFIIRRNITLIQDYSATGKTEMIRLLSLFKELGNSSGVIVSASCNYKVLSLSDNINNDFGIEENTVHFADENISYVKSVEFARVLKKTGSYVVIINREDIYTLPYSTREIYRMHNSGKFNTLVPVYKDVYNDNKDCSIRYITEDEKSSYFALRHIYGDCFTVNAGGNSNVMKIVQAGDTVIVDSAAFGPYIRKLVEECNGQFNILLPESFEFILLWNLLLNTSKDDLRRIQTFDFDYKDFFSYERFLTHVASGYYVCGEVYSKSNDMKMYRATSFKDRIEKYIYSQLNS